MRERRSAMGAMANEPRDMAILGYRAIEASTRSANVAKLEGSATSAPPIVAEIAYNVAVKASIFTAFPYNVALNVYNVALHARNVALYVYNAPLYVV
jgi:hypothetical protein